MASINVPKLTDGKLTCGCGATFLDIEGMAHQLEVSTKTVVNRRSEGTMPEALGQLGRGPIWVDAPAPPRRAKRPARPTSDDTEMMRLLEICHSRSSGELRSRLQKEISKRQATAEPRNRT